MSSNAQGKLGGRILFAFIFLLLLPITSPKVYADDPNQIFIPLVIRGAGSPQQNVQITYIFYDGEVPQSESDEYAEVTNQGLGAMNLEGWRLNAGEPSQDFIFPDYLIDPGQSCRVYTNELHPETCGFSFESGVALWRNTGDCGYLYNQPGDLVSSYCY